jgi:hypothetical protein
VSVARVAWDDQDDRALALVCLAGQATAMREGVLYVLGGGRKSFLRLFTAQEFGVLFGGTQDLDVREVRQRAGRRGIGDGGDIGRGRHH